MPQQRATTPEVIYETLTDDATFMALVGNVKFKQATAAIDAISIVTPGQPMPDVESIQGLEVVIHDIAKLERKNYVTDDFNVLPSWKVFLLAWPGANGTTLNSAATRMMELFSNATTIETGAVPVGLGAMAQLLVMVPSTSVVNT